MRVGIDLIIIAIGGICMFTQRKFQLTEEEYKAIEKWANTHECSCKHGNIPSRSCCGGEISVIFTPTTIGTAISARCICGDEIDLDNL